MKKSKKIMALALIAALAIPVATQAATSRGGYYYESVGSVSGSQVYGRVVKGDSRINSVDTSGINKTTGSYIAYKYGTYSAEISASYNTSQGAYVKNSANDAYGTSNNYFY